MTSPRDPSPRSSCRSHSGGRRTVTGWISAGEGRRGRTQARKAAHVTRDEQILAAAEKLFFERSFDGVGVDEIGKIAGTSGSAIYRHFPSKDAILAALFDKTLDTLVARIGEPEEDPRADVDKLVRS